MSSVGGGGHVLCCLQSSHPVTKTFNIEECSIVARLPDTHKRDHVLCVKQALNMLWAKHDADAQNTYCNILPAILIMCRLICRMYK